MTYSPVLSLFVFMLLYLSFFYSRGWDVGTWNHHEIYAIRLANDGRPTTIPEKISMENGFLYDTVQPQDQEELNQHLLIQTCLGAGNSLLRHPVVLSELYHCAQTDTQGCKILLARARDVRNSRGSSGKGRIIGSIILYHAASQMSKYFPVEDRKTGGLVGVVSSRGAQAAPIVEGLILKSLSILIDMGFNSAQTFIVRIDSRCLAPLLVSTPFDTNSHMHLGRRSCLPTDIDKPRFSKGFGISQYQQEAYTTSRGAFFG